MAKRESTIKKTAEFSDDYATSLLRRVERRLRRSARNRARREYARGYVKAANVLHGVIAKLS